MKVQKFIHQSWIYVFSVVEEIKTDLTSSGGFVGLERCYLFICFFKPTNEC